MSVTTKKPTVEEFLASVANRKLTVDEFLALDFPDDELNRYELHDGEVVLMTGPKPRHSILQTLLSGLFLNFQLRQPEFRPVVELTVKLHDERLYRPDLVVLLDPARGGRCVEEESFFSGPPLVVAEVLSSHPFVDLVTKRDVYAEAGVPEYWVLSPAEPEAAFLRLDGRHYHESIVVREGLYRTPLLPGFALDVPALFRRDFAALAAALEPPAA